MLLNRRDYGRRPPSKSAKSIYIFCEGRKTEYRYFKFFKELASEINIEVYELHPHENNSPTGLYEIACKCIVASEENPNPKYEFINDLDEVWFVIDTDQWKDKITVLKNSCTLHKDWNISQSNPCFEVWLYYHLEEEKPTFENLHIPKNWKSKLNDLVGGFNAEKHSFFIKTAINNSEKNYFEINNQPHIASTEVFRLANVIYPLIEESISSK